MKHSHQCAFIGLGAMGRGMASNLHKAGLLGAIYNRTSAVAATLHQSLGSPENVTIAQQLADVAVNCELIFTCVSTDSDLQQVIEQLLPKLDSRHTVIDCSTVAVNTATAIAAKLAAVSCNFLDAPVSGGTEGARLGTLAIMVGGDAAVLHKAKPALLAMGSKIEHMGAVGNGQATKAVNQIIAAGINQGVSEGLAFAKAMGLPEDKVVNVVSGGAAGSWFLQNRGPSMLAGQYPAGFKLALHHKDLLICKAMAAEKGVTLDSIEDCLNYYQTLMQQGFADEDISALFRLKHARFTDLS